jgi:hypothetical protein
MIIQHLLQHLLLKLWYVLTRKKKCKYAPNIVCENHRQGMCMAKETKWHVCGKPKLPDSEEFDEPEDFLHNKLQSWEK